MRPERAGPAGARRLLLVFAGVGLLGFAGYVLWLEVSARRAGFANFLERRAATASGILDPVEWRAMAAAGDRTPPASGGDTCLSPSCRHAQAMLGGRWRGGADCTSGSRYRFDDHSATIEDFTPAGASPIVRREYRLVGATVPVPLGHDRAGKPLAGTVEKRAGDLEIWTLGSSAYVRRIHRRLDADTVQLVLVQSRPGREVPVSTLYVEGRSTSGAGEVVYRRCADPGR